VNVDEEGWILIAIQPKQQELKVQIQLINFA